MNDKRTNNFGRSIFPSDQSITYETQIAGALDEIWPNWIEETVTYKGVIK